MPTLHQNRVFGNAKSSPKGDGLTLNKAVDLGEVSMCEPASEAAGPTRQYLTRLRLNPGQTADKVPRHRRPQDRWGMEAAGRFAGWLSFSWAIPHRSGVSRMDFFNGARQIEQGR
jgi:hypothetical protein